jgi:transcriptional regulator GlxA family with amidase domain
MLNGQRNVAILVFDQVEVLDFAGPYEVFNVTAELNDPAPFNVYTIAESAAPIRTRGQLSVNPNYSIYQMPSADILIVPGGFGSRVLLHKPHLINWLRAQAEQIEMLISICTGALVLAKAGLLSGLTIMTHHDNLSELEQLVDSSSTITVDNRYFDNGKILLAGGVSAGIDLSLYVIRKLLGDRVLSKTLNEMEYAWSESAQLQWPQAIERFKSL